MTNKTQRYKLIAPAFATCSAKFVYDRKNIFYTIMLRTYVRLVRRNIKCDFKKSTVLYVYGISKTKNLKIMWSFCVGIQ